MNHPIAGPGHCRICGCRDVYTYREWHIYYDPPPIPIRQMDWHYWHESYDGPGDHRMGDAPSLSAAKAAIDEWWAEQESDDDTQAEYAATGDCVTDLLDELDRERETRYADYDPASDVPRRQ